MSAIFLPKYPCVGASGGIFGLIGATLADILSNISLLFSPKVNVDSSSTFWDAMIVFVLLSDVFSEFCDWSYSFSQQFDTFGRFHDVFFVRFVV